MKQINWDRLVNKEGWTGLGITFMVLLSLLSLMNPTSQNTWIGAIALMLFWMLNGVWIHTVTQS